MIAEMRLAERFRPSPHHASMGPRSYDRGNLRCHVGAALGYVASMGPRSYDRGNGDCRHRLCAHRLASMGPRSYDRGNALGGMFPALGSTGFNGAAII